MRRSPRAYLELRRDQKGRCVRFRAVSRAAVRWHYAQLRGRFPPRDRAGIRAGRPVRPYPSPLEESPSRVNHLSTQSCIAEMEGKGLVNLTRTEALQSRDSIPAAAAVPRFRLRSK